MRLPFRPRIFLSASGMALAMAFTAMPAMAAPAIALLLQAGSADGVYALMEQAGAAMKAKQFAKALQVLDQAEAMAKTLPAAPPMMTLNIQLMRFYAQLDSRNLPAASATAREVMALRTSLPQPDSEESLGMVQDLGLAFEKRGYPQLAEPILTESVAQYLRVFGENDIRTLNVMEHLAIAYKDSNKLADAERLQRRLVAAFSASRPADDPRRLKALNNLGRTLEMQKRFKDAEALYREAFTLAEKSLGKDNAETLIFAGNLGAALMYQQRFAEAEPVIRATLEARTRTLGPKHPQRLYSLNDLATVLMFMERFAEAEPLFREAVPLYAEVLGKDHPFTLEAQANFRIALQRSSGNEQEAFDRALALLNDIRLRRSLLGGAGVAARMDERQAGYFAGFADAAWALGEKQPHRRAELLVQAITAMQEAMDSPAGQAVAENMARSMAGRFGPDLANMVNERASLAARWTELEESKTAAITSGNATGDAVSDEQGRIMRRVAGIDKDIAARFPGYAALVRPEPLNAEQLINLLRDDEALLMIMPGVEGMHLVAMSNAGAHWKKVDMPESTINAAVRRLLWDVGADVDASPRENAEWADEGGDGYPFDRQLAFGLYNILVAPVDAPLKGKRHVYIAASGSLSSLPFGLLVTEEPQGNNGDPKALRATKWFADAHALIQIPSVQSLAYLRKIAEGDSEAPVSGFVGYGDPVLEGRAQQRGGRGADGGRRRVGGMAASGAFRSGSSVADIGSLKKMARLPGTATELKAMQAAMKGMKSVIHLGAEATETAVKADDLSGVAVIAFATHGLTAGEIRGAAEPGLVLTPPATPSANDDGLLTASEVAALKLGADWVILSACNTAAGDGSEGAPGLSGLARAFFHAGARNLLASHWPVRDDVAARLTVRVIEIARDNPDLSRAEALQRAMREIRNNSLADSAVDTWAHPAAWAPFTLIGDGAR